ncbi:MAG: glycosyltransferase family 2 protein [Candidatus Baldrarchaeia archaeon]
MKMTVSGVLPVHNEEKYLPYSLFSLLKASLNELIIVFDRCTDNSETLVDVFREKVNYEVKKIHIKKREWFYPTAEVFKIGFENAKGDVIYSLAADCVYNPEIFKISWNNIDFASFPYFAYDIFGSLIDKIHGNWINFYKFILNVAYPKLTKKPKFSGIYAFKKTVYKTIPRYDMMSEDIWFLKEAWKKGFRYKYFPNLTNLHLRPSTHQRKDKQVMHGISRARLGYPLWKVLAHSILLGKPDTFKAYFKEKYNVKS